MFAPGKELMATMEIMIAREIKRLLAEADSCVFVLYDPNNPNMEPCDYICHERQGNKPISNDVSLDYEGIGIWYLVFRKGEVFRAKKILLHIESGQFKHGQMGDFEGYWEDFPRYILDDRWVQAQLAKEAVNDDSLEENYQELDQFTEADEALYENEYMPYDSGITEEFDDIQQLQETLHASLDEDFDDWEGEERWVEEAEPETHWFEPPEEKAPELSPFAKENLENKDLTERFDRDEIAVDEFPDRPFSRYAMA